MHPILFRIGSFQISMYGVMYATAFMVAIFYLVRETKKDGYDPNLILDLCYYILISAVVGARLFYIIINFDHYMSHPLDIFKIWQGGLVFYGGFILAVLMTIWFVKKHKMKFLKIGDHLAPALPLGMSIGRLGCFFAGCCYGKEAENLPWAVTFTHLESLAPKNIPLHPSQLYSSLGAFLIFILMMLINRYKKFDGQTSASFFIAYPIVRIFVERFRGDYARKFLPLPGAPELISTGDTVSFVVFLIGISWFLYLRYKEKHSPDHSL